MPIVSHVTELGAVQADGGRNVTIRYSDQDAAQYTETFWAPAGFDVEAKATARTAELSEHLADVEYRALVGL